MKNLFRNLLLIVSASTVVNASDLESPSLYLEKVANKMIVDVEANKAVLKTDLSVAEKLVRKNLIPAIDTVVFSKRTIASANWKKMSGSQQKRFTNSFISLVIGNYASGLSLYDGQKFKFDEPHFSKSGNGAKVRSSMKQSDGTSIGIVYTLSNKTGSWKIIDMEIEGVKMSKSYKKQFLPRLTSLGIEDFLTDLENK